MTETTQTAGIFDKIIERESDGIYYDKIDGTFEVYRRALDARADCTEITIKLSQRDGGCESEIWWIGAGISSHYKKSVQHDQDAETVARAAHKWLTSPRTWRGAQHRVEATSKPY